MKEELHELEQALRDLESKISKTAQTHRNEAVTYGNAKGTYEIRNAEVLIGIYDDEISTGCKLTEAVRKAKAMKGTEKEYMAMRLAEMQMDSSKEVLRAFLAVLSSTQTRCSLLKAEASLVAANYK